MDGGLGKNIAEKKNRDAVLKGCCRVGCALASSPELSEPSGSGCAPAADRDVNMCWAGRSLGRVLPKPGSCSESGFGLVPTRGFWGMMVL